MEFETTVYVKDYEELAQVYFFRTIKVIMVLFWIWIVMIVFLSLFFWMISDTFRDLFMDGFGIFLSVYVVLPLLHNLWYPRALKRKMCKELVRLSGGQETIKIRYIVRGQFLVVHDTNINVTSEFQLTDIKICKETRHYLVYCLSGRKGILFVEKSTKELQALKKVFQPKKYYDLRKKK